MVLRCYCRRTVCSVICYEKALQLAVTHWHFEHEVKTKFWCCGVLHQVGGLNLCFRGGTDHPKLTRGSLKWLRSSFRQPNHNLLWDQFTLYFFMSELAKLYEELPEYVKSGWLNDTGTFFMSVLSLFKSFLVFYRGLYCRYQIKRKKYLTMHIAFFPE